MADWMDGWMDAVCNEMAHNKQRTAKVGKRWSEKNKKKRESSVAALKNKQDGEVWWKKTIAEGEYGSSSQVIQLVK